MNTSDAPLTYGAVRQIFNNEQPSDPVLQVIKLKTLNGKIQIMLSDGQNFILGRFANTELTELCVNSIISLGKYSLMSGKKVMIIHEINVIQKDAAKVGDPKAIVASPMQVVPEELALKDVRKAVAIQLKNIEGVTGIVGFQQESINVLTTRYQELLAAHTTLAATVDALQDQIRTISPT